MRETLAGVSLVVCMAAVLVATMWPTPLDQGFEPSVQRFLEILHRTGVPEWFGYRKLEASANVVMFIPIGFLTAMLLPFRLWWIALIVCPALSVGIEMTQGALLAARFATPLDVATNSVGAVIGTMIAVWIRSIVYQRDHKIVALALWQRGIQE